MDTYHLNYPMSNSTLMYLLGLSAVNTYNEANVTLGTHYHAIIRTHHFDFDIRFWPISTLVSKTLHQSWIRNWGISVIYAYDLGYGWLYLWPGHKVANIHCIYNILDTNPVEAVHPTLCTFLSHWLKCFITHQLSRYLNVKVMIIFIFS